MLFLKKILLVISLLWYINSYAQVLRFNINDNAIGIQTPHHWNLYSHLELQFFPHPVMSQIKIGGVTTQLGWVWYLGDRVGIRSGLELTYWGFVPAPDGNNFFYYTQLIPLSIAIYPFEREYLGIDLYSKIDPDEVNLEIGISLLIRF